MLRVRAKVMLGTQSAAYVAAMGIARPGGERAASSLDFLVPLWGHRDYGSSFKGVRGRLEMVLFWNE